MRRRVMRYVEEPQGVDAEVRPYEVQLRFAPDGTAALRLRWRVADGEQWCRHHGMAEDRVEAGRVAGRCVNEILREVDTILRLAAMPQVGDQ